MKIAASIIFINLLPSVVARGAADVERAEPSRPSEKINQLQGDSEPLGSLRTFRASADLVADIIAGPGVTVLSASFQGKQLQAGLFSDGMNTVGLPAGAILSTGKIDDVEGPNDGYFSPSNFESPGFAPLESLTGDITVDAAVLTIKFKCTYEGVISFQYVFGSEDYSSSNIDYTWEDVMGAFLNGLASTDNIAKVNGAHVSVKTINCSPGNELCQYFIENTGNETEMNGFTAVLKAKGKAFTGSNILTIAIADGFDGTYPSWLLIGQNSLTCPPPPPPPKTKSQVCLTFMKGCPCENQSKLLACVKSRAETFCTLPTTEQGKSKFTNSLAKNYKKKCKK